MNLVFIHGAGSSSKVWTLQKRYFTSHSVTILDLPGHGGRAGKGRERIGDYVEDVRADIEEIEDPVLIGHSMGGGITMVYALNYPVKACILAGTGARLRVFPAILEQITENYDETINLILEFAVHNKTESIMRKSKEEMLSTPPEVMHSDLIACNSFDVMQEIETLTVPTLVVCGSQDLLAPVKFTEYLAAKIKNSHMEVIADCGHMLMLEKPEEFNSILETFLNSPLLSL